MAEYYKKDDVLNYLKSQIWHDEYGNALPDWEDVANDVQNNDIGLSSIDIVHCHECVYREHCKNSKAFKRTPPDDWFCADGKIKMKNDWKNSRWRDFVNDMEPKGEGE